MIRAESPLFGQMQRWAQVSRRSRDDAVLLSFPAMFVDIVITAADVLSGTEATKARGTSGGTITAGQPVYIDASDSNKVKVTDANASDAAAACVGIALHASLSGQPIEYQTGGNITLSAVLTLGKCFVCSATAGGIAPIADLATGWRTTILGVATSTTNLKMTLIVSAATNA